MKRVSKSFTGNSFTGNSIAIALCGILFAQMLSGCDFMKDKSETVTPAKAKVVYGADDRRDLFEERSPVLRNLASSTVALVNARDLSPLNNGDFEIQGSDFGASYGLCESERFYEQKATAYCSGFLVAPDIIMTAGHCMSTADDCSDTKFIFDFAYFAPGVPPLVAQKDNVYGCQSIIHSEANGRGADFALIQLDRPVIGRTPLALRSSGQIQDKDPLVVIGHPSGLPTKIADGASVRDSSPQGYFIANLDTYGGNSGSAVFNAQTFEVEGILVRGEADFEWTNDGCYVTKVCNDDECRGEDVTRISDAAARLPQ